MSAEAWPQRVGALGAEEELRHLGDDRRQGARGATQPILLAIARIHRLPAVGEDQHMALVTVPLSDLFHIYIYITLVYDT